MVSAISLSDSELRAKLNGYGYPVGPVTNTTRKILTKKLESLMKINLQNATISNIDEHSNRLDEEIQLLFFDIETSGLEMNCDVLQIAVKSEFSVFNEYIKPKKIIPWNVYFINGFSNRGGELYLKEQHIPTKTVRNVLEELFKFLKRFEKKCVLVAHNCSFDAFRLLRIIRQEAMENQFESVIAGFTDTLAMFREKFPERRGKGSCTLTTLVTETLSLSIDGAHDANNDILLLEKLALHHFTVEQLIARRVNFSVMLKQQISKSRNI